MIKERTHISFYAECADCNDYNYWDVETQWESAQEHANSTGHQVHVEVDLTYSVYADKPIRCTCPNCIEAA